MTAALLLVLSLISYEAEDTCSPYLQHMDYAAVSDRWSAFYDSVNTGFLTSQGSLDDDYWYTHYQAKFDVPLYRRLHLRYEFHRVQNYGVDDDIHRFEPTLGITGDLYGQFIYEPTFLKRTDAVGIAALYLPDNLNYARAMFFIRDFENNIALGRHKPGPSRDLYTRQPYGLVLEARRQANIGFVKIAAEYITPSVKKLDDPAHPRETDASSFAADGRFELLPVRFFSIGSTVSYRYSGSQTIGAMPTTDTLSDLTAAPYLLVPVVGRLIGSVHFGLNYKRHNLYRRSWFNPGVRFQYRAFHGLAITLGYQHSWRNRSENGVPITTPYDTHDRIDLWLEYTFPKRGAITFRQGIDVNNLAAGLWVHSLHPFYFGVVLGF